ncbi:MAG: thioredoxin family protein [Myxococcales bacterium]|nr:thioredoxin family protein [Myxococcales bacterium]
MSESKPRGAPYAAIALLLISLLLAARSGGLFQDITVGNKTLSKQTTPRQAYRRPTYRKYHTLQAVVREASKLNRPIFLDLYAVWCHPCKKLERETFSHPSIAKLLDKFLVVKFDIDRPVGKSIVYRYRISRFPTTLILDPQGREIERIVGYYPSRFFAAPLQATLQKRFQYNAMRAKAARSNDPTEQLAYAKRLLLRREIGPARQLFQKLQKLDPQDQKKVGAAALFGEARTYTRVNAYAQAIPLLQSFQTRHPQSKLQIDAHRLLLTCYDKVNRRQDYQKLYTLFQKRYPKANIAFD